MCRVWRIPENCQKLLKDFVVVNNVLSCLYFEKTLTYFTKIRQSNLTVAVQILKCYNFFF